MSLYTSDISNRFDDFWCWFNCWFFKLVLWIMCWTRWKVCR